MKHDEKALISFPMPSQSQKVTSGYNINPAPPWWKPAFNSESWAMVPYKDPLTLFWWRACTSWYWRTSGLFKQPTQQGTSYSLANGPTRGLLSMFEDMRESMFLALISTLEMPRVLFGKLNRYPCVCVCVYDREREKERLLSPSWMKEYLILSLWDKKLLDLQSLDGAQERKCILLSSRK